MKLALIGLLSFFATSLWSAPLKVVTSTTDLAWAVKEIGGDLVEVRSLLKGHENPHYADATPEFIRLVADAKLVVSVGLELEVGWIPKVLSRSGNAQVQPGAKGYVEVAKGVHILDKPTGGVDRSMGDVHPGGNPHFWLSPTHFAQAAGEIAQGLMGVDPSNVAQYSEGLKRIRHKFAEIQADAEKKLRPVLATKGNNVVIEYHKEFTYFTSVYGLQNFGSVEEKPGVLPSAGRLAEVATAAKGAGVRIVLAAETAPKKTLERFTELSGIPAVIISMSMQPSKNVTDYATHHAQIVDAVVKALGTPRT